ncbi:MAG: ABC transporter permease [Geminicoccaceae bacterium]|nr:ABC transporter permease [Geminicoccaceae bacterium]MCX8102286.1 ABC transporter permease [Geminicoccaceae bacterium]
MRLEPRAATPAWLAVAAPTGAVAAALLVASAVLWAIGIAPLTVLRLMVEGALGSTFAMAETATRATPLLLTGLAAAIAFRARFWNIGGEGQLYLGAMAAVALGSGAIEGPPLLLVPLVLAAGAIAGALGALLPALGKVRAGADEVVTTLLLNFVIALFVQMMLEGPLKDPMGLGWPQSPPLLDEAMLPRLVERQRLHAGLLLGLLLALLLQLVLARTVWGLAVRAVGHNPRAAAYAGLPVARTTLAVAMLSGALAGLAGAGEVAGLKGYLTADLSPGYGYAGIVVAMLAGLSPLAVVPAAFLVAAVFVGADTMGRGLGISSYFADLVVALALLFVLAGGLLMRYRLRFARGPA